MTTRIARPPGISVCDLMLQGLLSEDDILPGGNVDETKRVHAEAQYASFMLVRSEPPRRAATTPRTVYYTPRPPPTPARAGRRFVFPPPPPPPSPPASADKSCCICKTREKTHAPYPCFHMCMCGDCAGKIASCPLCRCQVSSIHRIFT